MRNWKRKIVDTWLKVSNTSVVLSVEDLSISPDGEPIANCGRVLVLREVGETNREVRIPGTELRPIHESYPDRVSVGWNKLLTNGYIRIGYAHPFTTACSIAVHPREDISLFVERSGESPVRVLYAYITPGVIDGEVRISLGSRPVRRRILQAVGLGLVAVVLFCFSDLLKAL